MALHFKSKEAYQKYLAYKHSHGIEKHTNQTVHIAGKPHKVDHKGVPHPVKAGGKPQNIDHRRGR